MNTTALAVAFGLVGVLVGFLGVMAYRYRRLWLACKQRLELNLDVDLDLATSDQLVAEMRKRPRTYVLLLPVNNVEEGCFGLTVESHGLDAIPTCGILKMAGAIAQKELQKQGIEFPDMPDDFGPFGQPM